MSKKTKIGIIGLGGIAHMAHFQAFSQIDECEIVAGCDLDKSKFVLAKGNIKNFYTSYKEMLGKEKLDAVVVGTPNNTHVDISIAALNAGIHVLCEKPVGINAAEAIKLKAAADKSSAKLMIGQCFRFRPQTPIIMDLIKNKKLGEIYYCKASYLRQRGIPGFGTWFTDKSQAAGGVVLDLGVHMIDYFWYLLGKPEFKSVSATTYGGIGKRILNGEKAGFDSSTYPKTYNGIEKNIFDVDEMGSAFIRFANGIVLQLEVSWAMNIAEETSDGCIYGDRGSVTLNPVKFMHDETGELKVDELPFVQRPSHDGQAEQFINFIKGKIANPAPVEDAIEVIKILDAIYESAAEQKEISL